MQNVCKEINLENVCKEIHTGVGTPDLTFSKSVIHSKISLEDSVIGSNDFAVKYLGYIRGEVVKLKVNPNFSNVKENIAPEAILENQSGQSYMYVGRVKEHPDFNTVVEKFVNHLADDASVDTLIASSNICEHLTCIALDPRIATCVGLGLFVLFYGALHQPGGCIDFLEGVKNKLPTTLERAEDANIINKFTSGRLSYKQSFSTFVASCVISSSKAVFMSLHKICLPLSSSFLSLKNFISKKLF